jgi:hypothetical protein
MSSSTLSPSLTKLCLAVFLLGGLGACQSGGLSRLAITPDTGAAPAAPSAVPQRRMRSRPGTVQLSDQDLAPVDAFISTRNSQWILGDQVDVYASKEYFSQALTMNAKIGLVHRRDEKIDGDEIATLTFIGHESQRSAMSNPRVLIGTGLTVSARKVLRVRMARTVNTNVPVQLRIVATGNASRGQKEEVLQRGPQLQMGGSIRNIQGRWTWRPIR